MTAITKKNFPVTGMSCASCASSVESTLSAIDGVHDANVNLADNSVTVAFNTSTTNPDLLKKAVQKTGYDLIVDEEESLDKHETRQRTLYSSLRLRTILMGMATLPVAGIGMFFMDWKTGNWLSLALTIPVLFILGKNFYTNAWKQLKNGRANMDTLVALSTFIAFAVSIFNTVYPQFWEDKGIVAHVYYESACVIMFFVSIGKLLEERAKNNTTKAIYNLMKLQPAYVSRIKNGHNETVPINAIDRGDQIRIKPGERVPLDGRIESGHSYVDESMLSGEPTAVAKQPGDKLYAGTLNQKGAMVLLVESGAKETVLAQIIEKVKEAQGSKAPVQHTVDKVAAIFVPVILGISLLTLMLWVAIGGASYYSYAIISAVTVLVIACPCALGLATPTALMVGIGRGAEQHILIKDAQVLEVAHKIDTIVFDKTGTLTEGKPRVHDEVWKSDVDKETAISWLIGLEQLSEHPLATAIVSHYKAEDHIISDFQNFLSIPGRGIRAQDTEGCFYYVGNERFMKQMMVTTSDSIMNEASEWQKGGSTVIFFAKANELLAAIAIKDNIKESAQSALKGLTDAGMEIHMLTGDNKETAANVATALNIQNYEAEVFPSKKESYLKQLQEQGKIVAMVGDGINDSQALASANVGIAMGHGADVAMDVAPITLLSKDLNKIIRMRQLSGHIRKGIRQNLFWAFIYNIIGIPIAAGLLYPVNGFLLDPMIASAAMAFSSVSVVLNSLRLKSV